jgi:hypothetical protein
VPGGARFAITLRRNTKTAPFASRRSGFFSSFASVVALHRGAFVISCSRGFIFSVK